MIYRERQAFAAVREGDLQALRRLLETDPELAAAARQREHGATLLHVAASRAATGENEQRENGDVDLRMLDLLLDAGADPDARAVNGSTALHWCVRVMAWIILWFTISLLLVSLPSNQPIQHPDPTHNRAAGNGHVPAVRRLLQRGADAHATTYTWGRSVVGKASGQTASHWAAESGFVGVVEVIASHAPLAVVLPDERGRRPRELAGTGGEVEAVLAGWEKEEFVCVEARVEGQAVRVLREGQRQGSGRGGALMVEG